MVRKLSPQAPLPFSDDSVDVVYHAHVLEHLPREQVQPFLAENLRVLRPGGILRVVVPDLEALCRAYLSSLRSVARGTDGAEELYDWSMLDLLDQMVRRAPCGDMPRFVASLDLDRHPEIDKRITLELRTLACSSDQGGTTLKPTRRSPDWPRMITRLRERAAELAVAVIAGRRAAAAFREGMFRQSGEVHHWMYDRHSLTRALEQAGFTDVALRGPCESAISGFAGFDLDSVGGRTRRPGSLFIEGAKPTEPMPTVFPPR